MPPPICLRKQRLAELVHASLAFDPLCCFQRAASEAFPAAGGVSERQRVGLRIEANVVRAGMTPGAVRTDIDVPSVPRASSYPPPASKACRRARLPWCRGGSPTPMRRIRDGPSTTAQPLPQAGRTPARRPSNSGSRQDRVVLLHSWRTRSISFAQPVVPTTTFTPKAASRSTFSTTVSRRREFDSDIDTWEVRRRQTFEIRVVVFVQLRPLRSRTQAQAGRSACPSFHSQRCAIFMPQRPPIGIAEEFGVQPFYRGLQVFVRDHDTQVEQRRTLGDHANVDVAQVLRNTRLATPGV